MFNVVAILRSSHSWAVWPFPKVSGCCASLKAMTWERSLPNCRHLTMLDKELQSCIGEQHMVVASHGVRTRQNSTKRNRATSQMSIVRRHASDLGVWKRQEKGLDKHIHVTNIPHFNSTVEFPAVSAYPLQPSLIRVQRLVRSVDTISTNEFFRGLEVISSLQRHLAERGANNETTLDRRCVQHTSRDAVLNIKGRGLSPRVRRRFVRKYLQQRGLNSMTSFRVGNKDCYLSYLSLLCSFACVRGFEKLLSSKEVLRGVPLDTLVRGAVACSHLSEVAKQQSCYYPWQRIRLKSTIDTAAWLINQCTNFSVKASAASSGMARQLQSNSKAFSVLNKVPRSRRVFRRVYNSALAPSTAQYIQLSTDNFVSASSLVSAALWKRVHETLAPQILSLLIRDALRSARTVSSRLHTACSNGVALPVKLEEQCVEIALRRNMGDLHLSFPELSNIFPLNSLAVLMSAVRKASLAMSKRRKLILSVFSCWHSHPEVRFLCRGEFTGLLCEEILQKRGSWKDKLPRSTAAIAKICHVIVLERIYMPVEHVEAIGRAFFQAFQLSCHVLLSCTMKSVTERSGMWNPMDRERKGTDNSCLFDQHQHSWNSNFRTQKPKVIGVNVGLPSEDSKSSVAGCTNCTYSGGDKEFGLIYHHLCLGTWAVVKLLASAAKGCRAVQLSQLPVVPHLMLLVDHIELAEPTDIAQIADTVRVLLQAHHKAETENSDVKSGRRKGQSAAAAALGTETSGSSSPRNPNSCHVVIQQMLFTPHSLVLLLQKLAEVVVQRCSAFGYIELLSVIRLYLQLDLLLCLDLKVLVVDGAHSFVPSINAETRLSASRFIHFILVRLASIHPWRPCEGRRGSARTCLSTQDNRDDKSLFVLPRTYDRHVFHALVVKYPHIIRRQPKTVRRLLTLNIPTFSYSSF